MKLLRTKEALNNMHNENVLGKKRERVREGEREEGEKENNTMIVVRLLT